MDKFKLLHYVAQHKISNDLGRNVLVGINE
jgi:hypothetical protein